MLRVTAALWRCSVPRFSLAAPAMRHVRFNSTSTESFEQENNEEDEDFTPTFDPERVKLLQMKLRALKFPRIDKTKLQDAEFIAIADAASETIREIDDIREEDPRYWEASEFRPSAELGPHNYKIPSGITPGDVDAQYEYEMSVGDDELDELEDINEYDESDPTEYTKYAEELRKNALRQLGRDESGGTIEGVTEDGDMDTNTETDERVKYQYSFENPDEDEEGAITYPDGERVILGDEGEEPLSIGDWRDEISLDGYDSKLAEDFEQQALEAMGDDAYINQAKPKFKTHNETLKDWYNEFKFVSRGGRFSLAKQTEMFAKYSRDYRAKATGEQEDNMRVADYRTGFTVNEVVQIGRHCKVTKGGRVFSYSTLILVGTGKGTAGFGYGKGPTAAEAADRAYLDAERNLVSIPLYRGGLATGFAFRKRGSFMKCWTQSPGPNRNMDTSHAVSHPVMQNLLLAFGINNANLRSWKRRNWHNMLEGFFTTIARSASHPEDTARKLGLKMKVLAHEERFDKLKPHYT